MKQLFRSLFRRGRRRPAPARKPAGRRRPALESLEDRTVPSITIQNGTATLTGTAGPDTFRISLASGNPANIVFTANNETQSAPLASINQVTVNGLQGSDRLIIDNSNGLVGSTAAGGLPITFNGGSSPGVDTLIETGKVSGAVNETLTYGNTTGTGTLTVSAGGASQAVTFNQVSAIVDTLSGTTDNLTVNLSNNGNIALLTQGPTINGARTFRLVGLGTADLDDALGQRMEHHGHHGDQGDDDQGDDHGDNDDGEEDETQELGDNLADVNNQAFPALIAANKTSVTINLGNGNNFLLVNLPQAPAGLTSLTVNGGTGRDVLALARVPSGVTVTPTGTPNTNGIERVLTDADDIFIEELFELRLGRDADDAGLEAWRDLLKNSHDLLLVSRGIERSEEGREHLVRNLFRRFLGRDADDQGLRSFTNFLLRGEREEDAIAILLASPEFLSRAENMFPNVSPSEAYIDALFQLVLNRPPSQQELSNFQQTLTNVNDFGQRLLVAETFVESQEFRLQEILSDFANLLHRRADDDGLSAFLHARGLGVEEIREAFLSSQEFHDDD